MINEQLAKRAKENMSFDDYKEGSSTAEYNRVVEDVAKKIEAAKSNVSEEAQERLDKLLNWYKSAYANWINKHNANGASHVSVMIAGPANYNMRKHDQWMNREEKLWDEYNEINNIDAKISAIIHGDKIIRTDDKNALEKLRDKLKAAEEEHQGYKDYNKKARKEGKEPYASYVLSNSNQRMRQIKLRIAQLEKLEEQKKIATEQGNKEIEINGIKIIDNLEANRLQIVFDYKPDADVRNKLKKNGFRWSPNNEAWQRYRSVTAETIAKELVSNL